MLLMFYVQFAPLGDIFGSLKPVLELFQPFPGDFFIRQMHIFSKSAIFPKRICETLCVDSLTPPNLEVIAIFGSKIIVKARSILILL